jgi:bifunctional DNA-binding transcriptional regulator/antitoxin component of YhaV-PrlF toxin-antitoxin module
MTQYTAILLEDGDDVILPFPPELLETLGWKEGDTLTWIDNQDGSWTIKKDDII